VRERGTFEKMWQYKTRLESSSRLRGLAAAAGARYAARTSVQKGDTRDAERDDRPLEGSSVVLRLSEKQLSDILKVAGKRVFETGAPIVRQGKETNAAFFLILDGQVEVKRDDRTLSQLDSGQFFGEMALFGDQPRSADVIPTTDTTCLVIARWNLEELFKTSPDIPMRMLGVLSQRLHDTDKQLTE